MQGMTGRVLLLRCSVEARIGSMHCCWCAQLMLLATQECIAGVEMFRCHGVRRGTSGGTAVMTTQQQCWSRCFNTGIELLVLRSLLTCCLLRWCRGLCCLADGFPP
jgi:hypothetical protein